MKKAIKLSGVVLSLLILAGGCAATESPEVEKAGVGATTNQTVYSSVLPKVNTMIAVFRDAPMNIIVADITNDTGARGKLPANINVITKTSLNKIGPNVTTVQNTEVSSAVKQNAYILSGAITEFDTTESQSHGIQGTGTGTVNGQNNRYNADGSMDSENQTIRLTINFIPSSVDTGNFIPRTSTSNSVTIKKKSSANEFAFSVLGTGFGFNNAITKSQGIHSSITALVELSIAEVLGKLGKFPYWLLIKGGKPNSDIIDTLSRRFLHQPLNKKIQQVSYLLALHGKDVSVTRAINPKLKQAIISYKQEHGLGADDNIDKKLFVSLLK